MCLQWTSLDTSTRHTSATYPTMLQNLSAQNNLRLANAHFGFLLSWACNNGWYSALFYFSTLEKSKKPNDSILGHMQSTKSHLESGLMLATGLFYGLLKDPFPKSQSIGQTSKAISASRAHIPFPCEGGTYDPKTHPCLKRWLRNQRIRGSLQWDGTSGDHLV